MEQQNANTPARKSKHLNWNERILIEGFLKAGMSESNIAKELQRDRRTLNREVGRGVVEHLNSNLTTSRVYSADRAQDVHDLNASAKGPTVKLKANSVAVEYIRCHIVISKWSPEVVAARMKMKGMEEAVCAKTIYNHIDKGEIPGVSNETLWEKRLCGKTHKSLHRRPQRGVSRGRSIEERPIEVSSREEAGHWEIDLVVSGNRPDPTSTMHTRTRLGSEEAMRTPTELFADSFQRGVI